MIDEFIAAHLASVDDLAELKVLLVTLRLMEQRNSATAHVTLKELANHPALRDGLGAFPRLALENALRRGLARGVLLSTSEDLGAARFLANNEPSRQLVTSAHGVATPGGTGETILPDVHAVQRSVLAEIERLEALEAYPASKADTELIEEWLQRGYVADEIKLSVRRALNAPRRSGEPHRTLKQIGAQVTAQAPAQPTRYHAQLIARSERFSEEVIAFRELHDRLPDGREFGTLVSAVGLFGLHATIDALKRDALQGTAGIDQLPALLAEQHDAELAVARSASQRDQRLAEVIALYEQAMGLPATSGIADEMRHMLAESDDLAIWQAAFGKANAEGKRNWAYVRTIVRNPSAGLMLPAPVNDTAKLAFELYKRRVGRLDVSVANDINTVAQQTTDPVKWTAAMDLAAAANALNWNYIKAVLTRPEPKQGEAKNGTRHKRPSARGGATTRREQVDYTDETRQRAADDTERAFAELEERRRKRNAPAAKP